MTLTSLETESSQNSIRDKFGSTTGFRLPPISPRLTAVGIAFALFIVVDLFVILLLPGKQRLLAVTSSVFGAVVILLAFYLLLPLFERQQEQIDLQSREIETLHAMDAAIVRELDLPRLLEVAVRHAVKSVDGEAAAVAIFHPSTGKLVAEELTAVGISEREAERLRQITRSGAAVEEELWETLIVPLRASTDSVNLPEKRRDETPQTEAESEPTGYLMAARRRQAARVFTETDRAMLEALASTIDVAVTNVRALETVRENARVKSELARERRIAQVLTEGLLPDIPAQVGKWHLAKRYEAQSNEALVGGDIYDLFPLDKGRWGVVIADVSGKGLAAAKKTAMVKYSLRSYAREHTAPGEVLARLNTSLFEEEDLTGFVTLLYGVFDASSGDFEYASAGHETPILQRRNGGFEVLDPTGLVLGAAPDQDYDSIRVVLEEGDGLLLYTDGLTEARSQETGELLEIPGVQEILSKHHNPKEFVSLPDIIWTDVTTYAGGVMRDDTALLWLEYRSSPQD